jgi:hypothetical protein
MSSLKKGKKFTISTDNGISRSSDENNNQYGILEISGPGVNEIGWEDGSFEYDISKIPQLAIGATDYSGIFQIGVNNNGNSFLAATDKHGNKDLYIQRKGGRVGVNMNMNDPPSCSFHINATDALIIPVGDTSNRPGGPSQIQAENGMIRYNTQTTQFEGYGPGSAWGSLGGVKDVNGDTYILAETTAGANNDDLQFFTAGQERMIVDSSGNVGVNGATRFRNNVTVDYTMFINDIELKGKTAGSLYNISFQNDRTYDNWVLLNTSMNDGTIKQGEDWIIEYEHKITQGAGADYVHFAIIFEGDGVPKAGNNSSNNPITGYDYNTYIMYYGEWNNLTTPVSLRLWVGRTASHDYVLNDTSTSGVNLNDLKNNYVSVKWIYTANNGTVELYFQGVSAGTINGNGSSISPKIYGKWGFGEWSDNTHHIKNPRITRNGITIPLTTIHSTSNSAPTISSSLTDDYYFNNFLDISGITRFRNDVIAYNNLDVSGTARFVNNVTMNDNLTVDDYVGIGTAASNSYRLNVNGNAYFGSDVTINNNLTVWDNLTVHDYVGIGTTNSNTGKTLEIKDILGGGVVDSIVKIINNGGYHMVSLGTAGPNNYNSGSISIYKFDKTKTVYLVGSGENSYFNGGGNVGIGTSDPSNNLHVSGTGDTIARFTTTKNTDFDWIGSNMIIESIPSAINNGLWATLELKGGLWDNGDGQGNNITNYTGTMHGAGITSRYGYSPNYRKYCDLYLYTSDWTSSTPTKKTRMILTADGKVGIGLLDTEIETYNFDVSGTTRFRNDVTINQNVGIGTTSPDSNLQVRGDPSPTMKLTYHGSTYTNGTVYTELTHYSIDTYLNPLTLNKFSSTNINMCEGGGKVGIGGSPVSDGYLTVYSSTDYNGIKLMNGTSSLIKMARGTADWGYLYAYGPKPSSISGSGISVIGGYLAIGTTTEPYAPLVVQGQVTRSANAMYLFRYNLYASSNTTYWEDTSSYNIGVHVSSGIYAGNGYSAPSDFRIKENICEVPDDLSLEKLRNIEVKYYEYKDKLTKGQDKTIGFIAQQVKTVMPMAVKNVKEFIPILEVLTDFTWEKIDDPSDDNNYKLITNLTDVSGVKCKFYVSNDISNGEIVKEVVGNSDNTFYFDSRYNNVFYYGQEVDDFNSLDKSKLFALNFSATQEIDRIQQQHIIDISNAQATIQTHQTDLSNANTTIQTLQTDLSTANTTIQQHETTIQQQQQQIADILSRLESLESSA